MNRREMLRAAVGGVAAVSTGKWLRPLSAQPAGGPFATADAIVEQILKEDHLAGGSMTIAHHGHVVLSRGYGLADVAARQPVTPKTLFSIASVTKAITGVGILKLVEERKLALNARLVDVLSDLKPLPGKGIVDPRFKEITVHDLLYHAGGFPGHFKAKGNELDQEDEEEADAQASATYRALMSRPLEFAPGTRSKYSNVGFVMLQLVIDRAAGQGYESYARQNILEPMGITRMHMEKPGDYEPNETRRYKPGGRQLARRLVANWLASSGDLVRFVSNVAGSNGKTFLSRKMTTTMLAPPPPPVGIRPNGDHVGLGWDAVHPYPRGNRFSKNGGKPGVQAWLEHMESGIDWAFLYNTSPPEGKSSRRETVRRIHEIFERIRT